jgi:HTH-type transcriptional regulator/antitoxin HigA
LVRLIEDFESQHYQLNVSTPRSRILHLLEARDLEIGDLVSVLGSSELVSQVINGEVGVTREQGEILGKFFHVDGSLFVGE